MATLTTRQQLARNLANELGKMDRVWVTSPLPLDDNQKLRVQIADTVRNEVIQTLRDWGWTPQFVSILPRVCPTGLAAACLFEIDLPRERVVDDRAIPKDDIRRNVLPENSEAKTFLREWYNEKTKAKT